MYDPGILPPVPTLRQEREFTDRAGNVFTLAFEVDCGGDTRWQVVEKSRELLEHWSKPERVVRFRMSQALAYNIARLMTFQVMPAGENEIEWHPWPFEWWGNLMRLDIDTFTRVVEFLEEIESQAEDNTKND